MTLKLTNNGLSVYGTKKDGTYVSFLVEADEYKQWLLDGNTPEPEFTEQELLANAKESKKTQIRNEFNASQELSVTVNGVDYSGGFDSAIKLDAAKRLVEVLGAIEVTFYDVRNVGNVLSLAEAQYVVATIAMDYQTKFGIKQVRMVAVENATTIQEVEVV